MIRFMLYAESAAYTGPYFIRSTYGRYTEMIVGDNRILHMPVRRCGHFFSKVTFVNKRQEHPLTTHNHYPR